MSDDKKPFDHKDYRIGDDWFNLSKWLRENTQRQDHEFQVGDTIVITITTEVISLQRDCDGTPLYRLHNIGGGWNGDDMRIATEEEKKNY